MGLSTQCSVTTVLQACLMVDLTERAMAWSAGWATATAGWSQIMSSTSLQTFTYSISSVSTVTVLQTFSAAGVHTWVSRISLTVWQLAAGMVAATGAARGAATPP